MLQVVYEVVVDAVDYASPRDGPQVLSHPVDGELEGVALPEGDHGQRYCRIEVAAGDSAAHQDANHQGQAVAEGDVEEEGAFIVGLRNGAVINSLCEVRAIALYIVYLDTCTIAASPKSTSSSVPRYSASSTFSSLLTETFPMVTYLLIILCRRKRFLRMASF